MIGTGVEGATLKFARNAAELSSALVVTSARAFSSAIEFALIVGPELEPPAMAPAASAIIASKRSKISSLLCATVYRPHIMVDLHCPYPLTLYQNKAGKNTILTGSVV
jgi:hypothetical protein